MAVGHDFHPMIMNIMCYFFTVSSFYICNSRESSMSERFDFHVGHLALVTWSPHTSNGHVSTCPVGYTRGSGDSVIGIPKQTY